MRWAGARPEGALRRPGEFASLEIGEEFAKANLRIRKHLAVALTSVPTRVAQTPIGGEHDFLSANRIIRGGFASNRIRD